MLVLLAICSETVAKMACCKFAAFYDLYLLEVQARIRPRAGMTHLVSPGPSLDQ